MSNPGRWLSAMLAVALGAGLAWAQGGRNITMKGSDTMVILGQKWAEVFMARHAGIIVQVTGGGSGVGIAALLSGTTDIAQSSRPMRDAEKQSVKSRRGREVLELPVAVDGLAVFVHDTNPVSEISLQQLRRIYIGALKNWRDIGGRDERIILYSRENNSGTYVYFKEYVLGNADFFPTVQTLPGTAAVINAVAKDRRGIGYGGIAYGRGIKHLRVRAAEGQPAIEPTIENVISGRYPISRSLFWYLAGKPEGELRRLVQWVVSKEGQAVVENVGYYPLNEATRMASAALLDAPGGMAGPKKAAN